MGLGKKLHNRMKEKMIRKDEPEEPAIPHHPQNLQRIQSQGKRVQLHLPKTPIQQRIAKWFDDRA